MCRTITAVVSPSPSRCAPRLCASLVRGFASSSRRTATAPQVHTDIRRLLRRRPHAGYRRRAASREVRPHRHRPLPVHEMPGAVKAINPNVQIYLYEMDRRPQFLDDATQRFLNGLGRYNVSRGHRWEPQRRSPELFLLDSLGNRIYNVPYSIPAVDQYWHLMDFGAAAYQSYWLTAVKPTSSISSGRGRRPRRQLQRA